MFTNSVYNMIMTVSRCCLQYNIQFIAELTKNVDFLCNHRIVTVMVDCVNQGHALALYQVVSILVAICIYRVLREEFTILDNTIGNSNRSQNSCMYYHFFEVSLLVCTDFFILITRFFNFHLFQNTATSHPPFFVKKLQP